MKLSVELLYEGIDFFKMLQQTEAWDWTIQQQPELIIITTTTTTITTTTIIQTTPHEYLNVSVLVRSLD